MRLSRFIAWRYLFAKKSHNVINIISIISAAGIAVGCAALVVILSIYNGFDSIVRDLNDSHTADVMISPARSPCCGVLWRAGRERVRAVRRAQQGGNRQGRGFALRAGDRSARLYGGRRILAGFRRFEPGGPRPDRRLGTRCPPCFSPAHSGLVPQPDPAGGPAQSAGLAASGAAASRRYRVTGAEFRPEIPDHAARRAARAAGV